MANLFDVVEGWTQELGPFTLKVDGVVQDLTGMTVRLHLRDKSGTVLAFTGTTRVDNAPSTGKAYYTPAATDLTNARSPIDVRWEVVDGAGKVVFFPNGKADQITVYKP
jgi:hypothetical protein